MLILGASGFVGTSIRRALAHQPELADIALHFRRPESAVGLPSDVEWQALDLHEADKTDCVRLLDAMAPDVVVNCVGLTTGAPAELRNANVGIVGKLVSALEGRTRVHLIHLGSGAEYGMQQQGKAVTEDMYAAPVSAYGVTKFEATQFLVTAALERRISVTVLRVFDAIGRHSPASTLPGHAARRIAAALRDGSEVVHLSSLDSYRDYVDTRDVARAALAATINGPSATTVLNVGRGEPVLTRELVTSLAALARYSGSIIESEDGSSRSARLFWQSADISCIRERLGWEPLYSVQDSLADVWDELTVHCPV